LRSLLACWPLGTWGPLRPGSAATVFKHAFHEFGQYLRARQQAPPGAIVDICVFNTAAYAIVGNGCQYYAVRLVAMRAAFEMPPENFAACLFGNLNNGNTTHRGLGEIISEGNVELRASLAELAATSCSKT
jgi:hypothetical protein